VIERAGTAKRRKVRIKKATDGLFQQSARTDLDCRDPGIALGQISGINAFRVLIKEPAVGFLNGLIWAVAVGTVAFFAYGTYMLGVAIGAATMINLLAACSCRCCCGDSAPTRRLYRRLDHSYRRRWILFLTTDHGPKMTTYPETLDAFGLLSILLLESKKSRIEIASMMQNILQLLTTAVNEKRCVAIRYRDQHQIRIFEPHAIYTDENGEMVVDGYQTRGYSSGGRPTPFWRPFRLKKITALSVLKETFTPRTAEGFNANKLKYKSFIAMVEDNTRTFVYPFQQSQTQEVGPPPPKNPYRR